MCRREERKNAVLSCLCPLFFFSFSFGVTPRKKQRNPLKKNKKKKGAGHRGQLSVRSTSDKIIWASRNPKTCARAAITPARTAITPTTMITPAHFSRLRCTAHSFVFGLQVCRRSTRR